MYVGTDTFVYILAVNCLRLLPSQESEARAFYGGPKSYSYPLHRDLPDGCWAEMGQIHYRQLKSPAVAIFVILCQVHVLTILKVFVHLPRNVSLAT